MAIKLGKIYGIPIFLDYSWFIIFFLVAWEVGFLLMPTEYPKLSTADYLFTGILSSVILFASILLHELAHSIVAVRNNLKIGRITLLLLGGVSEMEEEPGTPMLELKMSSAGPLTSLALSAIIEGAYLGAAALKLSPLLVAPLQYMAYFNFVVALFNLIPAFPMDGGRVLRSLIWMRNGDILRSTKRASAVGQGISYVMMFVGFLLTLLGDPIDGIWFILIGWFILSGARASLGQVIIEKDLQPLKAEDVMTRTVDSVTPEISLQDLYQEIFQRKHNGFPVVSGGRLVGCVTSHDLRKVKRDLWQGSRVSDIMTGESALITLKPGDPAVNAIHLMNAKKIGRIFVVDERGALVGIITRTDILRTVRLEESTKTTTGSLSEGLRRTFVAEKGMFFVIEQEVGQASDLFASFDPTKLRLADQRWTETNGKRSKQFVFEVLESGSHTVTLMTNQGISPKISR
jgi:Zn-dependent protease/CBS domain-containing protein